MSDQRPEQQVQVGDFVRISGGDHHGEVAAILPIPMENRGWACIAYAPSGGGLVSSATVDDLTPVKPCGCCDGTGWVDADQQQPSNRLELPCRIHDETVKLVLERQPDNTVRATVSAPLGGMTSVLSSTSQRMLGRWLDAR